MRSLGRHLLTTARVSKPQPFMIRTTHANVIGSKASSRQFSKGSILRNEESNTVARRSISPWNKDTYVSTVVESEFKSNKKQFIEVAKQKLNDNFIVTLDDWNQLTEEMKKMFPPSLRTALDKAYMGVEQQEYVLYSEQEREAVHFGIKYCNDLNLPFVSRNTELFHFVLDAFNQERNEKPFFVYCTSAPGLGKSRLLVEWIDQVLNRHTVIHRFVTSSEDFIDDQVARHYVDKLRQGEIALDEVQVRKVQFLNTIFYCKWANNFVGISCNTDLQQVRRENMDPLGFGKMALATILKAGLARKYHNSLILHKGERYIVRKLESPLPSITDSTRVLPKFIQDVYDVSTLLSLWYELDQENVKKGQIEYPFKCVETTNKLRPFVYLALDEVQVLMSEYRDSSADYKHGLYYLLEPLVQQSEVQCFTICGGTSVSHPFYITGAYARHYPPSPLFLFKYFRELIEKRFDKIIPRPMMLNQFIMNKKRSKRWAVVQLQNQTKKSTLPLWPLSREPEENRSRTLNSTLSQVLIQLFSETGGILRMVAMLLIAFKSCIVDNTEDTTLIASAMRTYEDNRSSYFTNVTTNFALDMGSTKLAALLLQTIVPVPLQPDDMLLPNALNPQKTKMMDLQNNALAIPFSVIDTHYYYMAYHFRDVLMSNVVKEKMDEWMKNADGSITWSYESLLFNPAEPRSSNVNSLGRDLELLTLNSLWALYKLNCLRLSRDVISLNKLFPTIKKFGSYDSDKLVVTWTKLKYLTYDYDFKISDELKDLEDDCLYKNGSSNAQHGDILFTAKTLSGERMRIAIECRNLTDDVNATEMITRGIHVLLGCSERNMVIKESHQPYQWHWEQVVNCSATGPTSFDVLVILAPRQSDIGVQRIQGAAARKIIDRWTSENKLLLFHGDGTIHDTTLKCLQQNFWPVLLD